MGVYDTVGNCQIKAGPCEMEYYEIGDDVPLEDGVYVSYEGVIVVVNGVFFTEFKGLKDKWGGRIDVADVLRGLNPLDSMNLLGVGE